MSRRKQQLPEYRQVRRYRHYDDCRIFHWRELPLQARPQLFASGFCNGFVRGFLFENHAQLCTRSGAPQRLHVAWHLLLYGCAGTFHLVPIIATYAAFLICSLVVACKVPSKGYFPAKNARNIKRGMILFFCCDACVGISLATGNDHSVQEIVATVANNFVWYFYTPALILLGLSGYKRKE